MFVLKVRTFNDAFREVGLVTNNGESPLAGHGFDVRQTLEYVAGLMEAGITSGVLTDTEGNKIGEWDYD